MEFLQAPKNKILLLLVH